jgi:hypothetical protein
MRLHEAEAVLGQALSPMPVAAFLQVLGESRWCRLPSTPETTRHLLLGVDPVATLERANAIAPQLTYHSANAEEPPPEPVATADPIAFRDLIDTFHRRRYSVRFPGMRPYATALDTLCRALEVVLHKPVTASAFWSQGGMRAPVHSDDHDLLVIQILGRKRWYVADAQSSLDNTWERIPGPPPTLGEHACFDIGPGDAVYVPRGTVHTVDGIEESIHVSIDCTPLTVREAVIAALDHLSDLDRSWRTTASPRLGRHVTSGRMEPLPEIVRQAAAELARVASTPGFVAAALQRRSARTIGHLHAASPPLPSTLDSVTLDSVLTHRTDCFCHLTANEDKVDVAYPGGHLYIHRGAEAAVVYITRTSPFRVRDIPGDIADEVRLSLARRFCEIGFLALPSNTTTAVRSSPDGLSPA